MPPYRASALRGIHHDEKSWGFNGIFLERFDSPRLYYLEGGTLCLTCCNRHLKGSLHMRRFIPLMFLVYSCGPAFQASAAVVFSQNETYASVSDGTSNNSAYFPNTGGTVAFAPLGIYSSTTTSLFNSAIMSGSFVQSRPGDINSYSYGSVSANFTTDVDVPYTAGGSYSNSGGYTQLFASLYDFTADDFLFYMNQESYITGGPAAFTLGGTTGDYYNNLGSLTGTLLAGHAYGWYAQASTQALFGADNGAEAGGNVSLTLAATVVPEFSSVIVWSLVALMIGGVCWWRGPSLAEQA